ncbi:MAG: DMT family transporter [Clostridiales bacterium]|nr:DMT family transporter [Clostridiales bacterium]
MTKKESNILLFSITLCWASSYIFIKDLPSDLSSYAYLTLTAGIAGVILLAVFHRSLRNLNKQTIFRGIVLAALIAGNMLLEKMGLMHISSSTASFLASLNIMIVPMILLLLRKFPTKNNVLGIVIILGGLAISNGISLTGGSLIGTLYMLGACVLMSLYTVAAAEFTKKSDPLLLSVLQICFSAIIGFILWFFEDPSTFASITWSKRMLSAIFILAFFSKAYAYIMLMYAEKYADAISVTVIASTEPVVTLTLALLIPNMQGETETFSARALAGAIVIALGAIVAGSNFLSAKKSNQEDEIATEKRGKQEGEEGVLLRRGGDAKCQPSGIRLCLQQFLLSMLPFAILGIAFKVMVLVEGFTEVRPANAIPIVAGLSFGAVGGLGCAVGNLIADCFGSFNLTSLLGVIGNFMAAYIPYRIWYTLRTEKPNVHTWKNLLLYLWAAYMGALSCAWILGFGLEFFFGLWMDTIYKYVFLNNLGFSIALGLPIFILMTSGSIHIPMRMPWKEGCAPVPKKRGQKLGILVAETGVLTAIMIGIYRGYHLSNHPIMCVLSVVAILLTAVICVWPRKKGEWNHG